MGLIEMNFEVFATEKELKDRVEALRDEGVTNCIQAFNGNVYTLKWTSP